MSGTAIDRERAWLEKYNALAAKLNEAQLDDAALLKELGEKRLSSRHGGGPDLTTADYKLLSQSAHVVAKLEEQWDAHLTTRLPS